jgi:hypothetical protein
MIDRDLRLDIMGTVRAAMQRVLEEQEEVWLSGDELCRQFQMFTTSWLKRYGHLLPRTKAVVVDGSVEHTTSWAYPRNEIQRLAREGKLKELRNERGRKI